MHDVLTLGRIGQAREERGREVDFKRGKRDKGKRENGDRKRTNEGGLFLNEDTEPRSLPVKALS